jgi:transcriptional regulator of PTS gene
MKDIFNSTFSAISNHSRLMYQKLRIIQVISQAGEGVTVPDICKELKISTPTGIKLVNELQEEGFLSITGKKATHNGRKPAIYGLKNVSLYALSVEILLKRITVGVVDLKLNMIYYRQKTDFTLENTKECLYKVEGFILECLEHSGVGEDSLLGMGLSISGNVNAATGESLTFFNFPDHPLADYFSKAFKLPVFVDTDTRCFGMAEKIIGKASHVKNAVMINLSRSLGTCLVIHNKLVSGNMGFAGEMAHMQFGNGSRRKTCLCGKKGCLAIDVGGNALEEYFRERITEGEKSMILHEDASQINYDHILTLALEGDSLSVSLVREMGTRLGYALGNIINLLNPELIVIGGKFAKLKTVLLEPLQSGLSVTAIEEPLQRCKIELSELGDLGGLKGAGAMVFEYFGLIKK